MSDRRDRRTWIGLRSDEMGSRRRGAFTLIELLVVVAIIALLISILLPALGKAKENGRRAVCLSNLHHLGQAFQQYLHDNNEVLPPAAIMPSVESVDPNDDFHHPSITEYLKDYAKNPELFRCPSDMPGKTERDAADPNKEGRSFWQTEGTSYQYTDMPSGAMDGAALMGDQGPGFVHVGDTTVKIRPESRMHPFHHDGMSTSDMYLLAEYEPYHGKRGTKLIRNVLFADLHVEEYLHEDPNELHEPNRP